MREFIAEQAREERGPQLARVQHEALPPLHEVEREHRLMLGEIHAAQEAAAASFDRTMRRWYWRHRMGKNEQELV